MKTNIKAIGLRRLAFGVTALAVSATAVLPVFSGSVSAAQVEDRYVKMSSSSNTATNVSYEIGFEVKTAGAVQGVIVDFCSNSPLVSTACTAPTGFTVGAATTTGSITGMTGTWSGASENSGRTLRLSLGTPGGTASANAPATFTLTTATNPTSAVGTFYARIYTFASAANASAWVADQADGSSTLNVVDSGGLALSTASQITVTAKVQETLTFCVYTGANCGAGGVAVPLGDTNGVLSTAGPFVDITTNWDIATNAASGAVVRFKAGLPTSGANTLATIGATGTASAAGTTQFGLCAYENSGTGMTITAPYADTNCAAQTSQTAGTGSTGGAGTALFAFDDTAAATTYGDDLASKTAGNVSQGEIAFIGNVSATQPAGIYTNVFTFIATGTY